MKSVGLVGAGPWARQFHAPMLSRCARLRFGAVWARRPQPARELAVAHHTVAVESFDALLERCDAVVFAVPPHVQAALAQVAAAAGRHLLLEKPLATTLADAERLAAAVDDAGVRTQLLLTLRYQPDVRAFLSQVAAGPPVRYVRGTYLGGGGLPGSPFATPWRLEPGAALLDVGPHTLDLMEAVAGPVRTVHAVDRHQVVAVTTQHDGGAGGQATLSITVPGTSGGVRLDVVTERGVQRLSPGQRDPTEVWDAVTDQLVALVDDERPADLDVHHGLRLQRSLEAVRRSAQTGMPTSTDL